MTTDNAMLSAGDKTQTGGTQKTDVAATADATKVADPNAKTEGQKTDGEKTAATQKEPDKAPKTEGDKTAEGTDKPALKAPEKYEFKAPEGIVMDEAVTAQYSEIARELDLPQDKAQEVIDKMGPVIAARQIAAIGQQYQTWSTAAQTDKELTSGDGFEANLAIALKGAKAQNDPELIKLLDNYHPVNNPQGLGLGNNPVFLRHFLKVGKSVSEDSKVVSGNPAPITEATAANTLYPAKPKQQ